MRFYFDFISPFGYFASLQVDEIAARHGRQVEWRPMLLGVSVLKVMGLKPLLQTPLKGDYLRRQIARHVRKHGLQLERDADAPMMDPRACARACYWALAHAPQQAKPLARVLYDRYWREGEDLADPDRIAAGRLPDGVDAAALRAGIDGEESRARLRAEVEESMKRGVFGSPTIEVDGELFWGVDALPEVEEWLARGGW